VEGNRLVAVRHIGKRIVWTLEGELFLVFHLMIAGRFHWKKVGSPVPGRIGLAAFDFPVGSLMLTEAGSKKRASLYCGRGEDSLAQFDPGGLDVLGSGLEVFSERLLAENHTLKRSLTDPRLFSGIGNAYPQLLHWPSRRRSESRRALA